MDKNIELLAKKHKIKPSLIEKWQKEGHFPFILFSEKELYLDNQKVIDMLHVYNNPAINRRKMINNISTIDNITLRDRKRIDEAKVYLEEQNIATFKKQLATFLDIAVVDTEVYKKEMKNILFDKRLLYRALRDFVSYDNHRRYWREEQWHLINSDLLNIEKNALQKFYNELFPTTNKKYSINVSLFSSKKPINLGAEGKSKEDAFLELQKLFPTYDLPFTANDLVETNATYDRLEGEQDTFDY